MQFGRRRSPIGIDLGTRTLKAVQLDHTRLGPRLCAALLMPRTAGTTDAAALAELSPMLARQGFTGRSVTLACPAARLLSEVLDLPSAGPGVPLQTIAEAELRRLARLEATTQFEFDYWPLPASARSSGGTMSVMAVAAADADTDPLADDVDRAGLELVSLDAPACALARACLSLQKQGITVVAELGATATTIVLAHEGRVVYQRAVADAGLNVLRGTVCNDLRLDDDEAECVLRQIGVASAEDGAALPKQQRLRTLLLQYLDLLGREIDTSIAFATHRYPTLQIDRVVLAGGGARLPNIAAELSTRLGRPIDVVTLASLGLVHPALGELTRNPQLVSALGLALNDPG
jgi:type IV pilus assembly protein PilM